MEGDLQLSAISVKLYLLKLYCDKILCQYCGNIVINIYNNFKSVT